MEAVLLQLRLENGHLQHERDVLLQANNVEKTVEVPLMVEKMTDQSQDVVDEVLCRPSVLAPIAVARLIVRFSSAVLFVWFANSSMKRENIKNGLSNNIINKTSFVGRARAFIPILYI